MKDESLDALSLSMCACHSATAPADDDASSLTLLGDKRHMLSNNRRLRQSRDRPYQAAMRRQPFKFKFKLLPLTTALESF